MIICVCICTFRRPQLVASLLLALQDQQRSGRFELCAVVVDNDRHASAQAAVAQAASQVSYRVSYHVEPRENIARARNAALRHASGQYVALIDDDEIPAADWLLQALDALQAHGVDGVLGPVRPRFERPPPRWLARGRFCERPEHPTGHLMHWRQTRTGNVLLRRDLVQHLDEPFSPNFGNGGEDLDFFRRTIDAGARWIWCNEAAVEEIVPPQRCRRRYFLRRALLRGQNERALLTAGSLVRSLVAVPAYLLALPFALLAGGHRAMDLCIRLCDHAGRLAGAIGWRPMGTRYLGEG